MDHCNTQMKKLFIVANWKSHKTVSQAHSFLVSFFDQEMSEWLHSSKDHGQRVVIFCPPFTLIATLKAALQEFDHSALKVFLGAQDISPFDSGSHTGEESVEQLKDLVSYVIIGHSERINDFHEDEDQLARKVVQAQKGGIEPIFCVQGTENNIPEGVRMIAFEPLENIGSGNTSPLERIEEVALFYKQERGIHYCLYGGSVTDTSVYDITSLPSIDGVLVGGASLDPKDFSRIVMNA